MWQDLLSKLMEIDNPVLSTTAVFETIFLKRMRDQVWWIAERL